MECKFVIQGNIADFDRVDNAFTAIKRETVKLLKDWSITLSVEYTEKAGTAEVP